MKTKLTNKQYVVPFILITSLFFLWGFARAILDVLNVHFRDTLDISITQSSLIQVVTYLGYFLMAIPAGMFINRYGYKRGVVFGLILYALGSFLFVPCSGLGGFAPFLICLFVIACGLAILETAANPYSAELGPKETSAARLNLSQSFNGFGSCLAPVIVGGFLFTNETAHVNVPYVIMGGVVVVVAIIFSFCKLPEIKHEDVAIEAEQVNSDVKSNVYKLLTNKMFIIGVIALFSYEVAEISINSYFVIFTTGLDIFSAQTASKVLSYALMFFMIGRFVGSWVMKRVSAERTLFFCAAGTVICMIGVIVTSISQRNDTSWTRYIPLAFLLANYVFEAIMFPTIFSIAIKGLGSQTKTASSILMMTPIGGCAFLLVAFLADNTGLIIPFVIPLIGYAIVWAFAKLSLPIK